MRITNFRSEPPRKDHFWTETIFGLGVGVSIFICIVAGAMFLNWIFG